MHILPYMEQQSLYELFKPYLKADEWEGDVPVYRGDCGAGGYEFCDIRNVNNRTWYKIQSPPYMRCPTYSHNHEQEPAANYAGSIGPQCQWGPCAHEPYLKYCNQPKYGIPRGTDDYARHGDTLDPPDIRGVFNRVGVRMTFRDIPDGMGHTIMIGEFSPQEHDHALPSNLHYTEATGHWLNSDAGYGHVHTLAPINYRTQVRENCNANPALGPTKKDAPEYQYRESSWQNWHLSWGFKSRHPGGANFLFADGSVHFLQQDINHQLYQFLGCRNDGQAVNLESKGLPPDP